MDEEAKWAVTTREEFFKRVDTFGALECFSGTENKAPVTYCWGRVMNAGEKLTGDGCYGKIVHDYGLPSNVNNVEKATYYFKV